MILETFQKMFVYFNMPIIIIAFHITSHALSSCATVANF